MSEETPVITEELVKESSPEEVPATPTAETDAPPTEETAPKSEPKKRPIKTRPKIKVSLTRGQELKGKVKTITDFGAFIDINLPQDGLVHISELSRNRVKKVKDVVSVGDEVVVWVKSLDKERNRISLTMRKPLERTYNDVQVDDVYDGEVTRIERYGVFVEIGLEREGLVHVSELSHEYIKTPEEIISVEDKIQVKVVKVNKRKKQVNLSIKALLAPPELEEVVEEVVEEETIDDEMSMATTMAAAFDRFNTSIRKNSGVKKQTTKSRKRLAMMDDVVNRTLKIQQDQE